MPDLRLHLDPDPGASVDALVHEMAHRRFLGEYADHGRADEAARAWAERMLPRSRRLLVHVDDVERGHVWLRDGDDDLTVIALTLDEHALAGDVRTALLALATDAGKRRLGVGVSPGDPALEELVRGGGFEASAIQMRLDLDHELPPESTLTLQPFDDADYAAFEVDEVEEYARSREKAGETREVALRTSREQHAELLPDGLATADHHFFSGVVDGDDGPEKVGMIWLGTERPMAFVYNVVVDEAHRRRGYGGGLMRAAALWSQARGAHALGLNVFGYNHGAKALYDGLGFHVVEQFVARTL